MLDNMIEEEALVELRLRRRLSTVPRWVTIRTLRQENVAEHSFQVCSIALWLLGFHREATDPAFRARVLQWAIEHDQDEGITGDTPAYRKTGWKTVDQMPQHRVVVKCADLIDMYTWAYEDQVMGNGLIQPIIDDVYRRFMEYWPLFDLAVSRAGMSHVTILTMATQHLREPSKMHPGLDPECRDWAEAHVK